jgi:hypothetical protein
LYRIAAQAHDKEAFSVRKLEESGGMQPTLIGSHAVFGKDIQNRGHCGVREAGFEKPIQKPTRGLLKTGKTDQIQILKISNQKLVCTG